MISGTIQRTAAQHPSFDVLQVFHISAGTSGRDRFTDLRLKMIQRGTSIRQAALKLGINPRQAFHAARGTRTGPTARRNLARLEQFASAVEVKEVA